MGVKTIQSSSFQMSVEQRLNSRVAGHMPT